jgi:predicted DCC family thiol-disulfide oxidoreductase YuxK
MRKYKNIFLYDGTCGFCRRRVCKWREQTKDNVKFKSNPSIDKVFFIKKNGGTTSGALAVLELLNDYNLLYKIGLFAYKKMRLSYFFEFGYNFIAKYRYIFSKIW